MKIFTKRFLIMSILLSSCAVNAQDVGDFSFEFSITRHSFNMESLNNYLTDTAYIDLTQYDSPPEEKITEGIDFQGRISYQPFDFMDFGVYTSYQSGEIERYPSFDFFDPEVNDTVRVNGTESYRTHAFGIGASTSLYINKLLKFQNKPSDFMQRLVLGVELSGGVGISRFEDYKIFDYGLPNQTQQIDHTSTDFQGSISLNLGYKILKNSLKSTLGIRVGYQFFQTDLVENQHGTQLPPISTETDRSSNLDFSGIFFGGYIKIGK